MSNLAIESDPLAPAEGASPGIEIAQAAPDSASATPQAHDPKTSEESSRPAQQTGARRYEALDAWRGLCCLLLVIFHTTMQASNRFFVVSEGEVSDASSLGMWVAARTWIGVPIFFVISGYCIMATLHARRKKGGVAEFAKRRFWRIYPPFWAALALSAPIIFWVETLWPGLLHDGIFTVPRPWEMSWSQWLGNMTLTESWRHCVFGPEQANLLPNTWSLCYEEQFYFVAALILLLAPRRIFSAAIVVTGVTLGGKVIARVMGWTVEGSIFDGKWLLIAAGILLYYRVHFATRRQTLWIHGLLALGILFELRSPATLLEHGPNNDVRRLAAFSFALLASWLYPRDRALASSRFLRPLRALGGISYSVYLCHPLIAKGISMAMFRAGYTDNTVTLLVVTPVCIAASLAAAICFHHVVERYFIPGK